jgi:hypothetical protein
MTKSFPPRKIRDFIPSKKIDSRRQEKQNTNDIFNNHVFFDVRSFLKAAKLRKNNISKKKEHKHTQFSRSTCKKNVSPIGPAVLEKKRENLVSSSKKRKTK